MLDGERESRQAAKTPREERGKQEGRKDRKIFGIHRATRMFATEPTAVERERQNTFRSSDLPVIPSPLFSWRLGGSPSRVRGSTSAI
jgi:hypothetical protein